jgi:acetate kinase
VTRVRVLVVNAGSSSVKLRVLGDDDVLLGERDLEAPRSEVDADELTRALADLPDADMVGHRVVHGGRRFREAVRVDDEVLRALHELADLAPLHQPKSLAALEAVSQTLPGLPAVACFDTAFHATLPAAAATYALPASLSERFGLRRYGFHGLSHAYASCRAAQLLGRSPDGLRVVTCHLGAGASLAAVRDGQSVDTTMGFTPLEGLVMATRSGSVDPGLVLWLLEHAGVTEPELADVLEHESGLLGLSGTADMRQMLARDDETSALALEVYMHRLCAGVAAMAAALDGLDALVFTGGVGENAPEVRRRAGAGLRWLGVQLDDQRNSAPGGDVDISHTGAAVRTLVIAAREDLEIARQVRAVESLR